MLSDRLISSNVTSFYFSLIFIAMVPLVCDLLSPPILGVMQILLFYMESPYVVSGISTGAATVKCKWPYMSDARVESRLNFCPWLFPSSSTSFHCCALFPRLRFVNGYLLWITFILATALPAALLTCEDINFPPGPLHLPTEPAPPTAVWSENSSDEDNRLLQQHAGMFVEDNGGVWMTGVPTSWM